MDRNNNKLIWGGLLAGVGFLLLMQNVGIVGAIWDIFWAMVFAAGGAALLLKYLHDRSRLWPAVGAFVLFGISASTVLNGLMPHFAQRIGGALFLSIIGAGLLVAYLSKPERWGAVIASGVFFTLAATTLVGDGSPVSGSIFFLGLGATFLALYVLPGHRHHTSWAIIPAIVLIGLGSVILTATVVTSAYVWALALIGGGIYLVYRNMHPSRA